MADASIRSRVADYYSDKVRQHGETARGVDWSSAESQRMRFDRLLGIVPAGEGEFSLLDYGCGYGALVDVLAERDLPSHYVGYDVSEEMVERASRLHGGEGCEFTTDFRDVQRADFVLASGVLNVKMDVPDDEWREYVVETLAELDRLSEKGFAFNALTSYSDPEHMRDDLFYADPKWLFDHCKRHYSAQVALLHDYEIYEFTILVRKNVE